MLDLKAGYVAAIASLSFLAGLVGGSVSSQAAAPEIRGTWLTTTSSDDWSVANLPGTMSSLRQVGLNTVYVEAWKNGYTNFTSTTLSTFTGTTSLNPSLGGRVLLNDSRTAAANAGMIHGAWFEYGMMAQYLGNTGTATGSFNPLARKCRDATWTVGTTSGTGWLLKDSTGNYTTASNGFVWMNPLVPEVRNLIKGIVVDAINQFDLQIVQFDDHLAWPQAFGWDDYTKAVYKQETNRNLPASSTDANFLAWRQGKTQAFFAEIADAAKAAKPSVIVSLAPSVIATSSSSYCANWSTWLGKTDEVLPQVYRSTIASFNNDWPGQITASGTSRAELGAGLRLLGTGSATPWNDLKQQIDKTRADNALGHSIWYSEGISNSGTSNPDNYRTQLTAYYDVATNGPAANPHFQTVRWAGTTGTGGSGTWSPLSATWKDVSTIWVPLAKGIFDGAGGTVTISGSVGSENGLEFRTGGYTVSSGTLHLKGYNRAANTVTVASGATATLATVLSGSAGLTKSGTGTLVIGDSGAPLTGGVAVDAGVLTIGAGGTTGSIASSNAVTVASGATLGFNRTDDYGGSFANSISGAGGILVSAGRLGITGSATFTGATTVAGGTLSAAVGTLGSTASIAVTGGAFSAVAYNPAAPLTVAAAGSATVSGTGLSLAAVSNANPAAGSIAFTATTGTITLAALSGTGGTRFASHAAITGGVSNGTVSVGGGLTASITGGTVTAAALTSGTVSGGSIAVSGPASITRISGGSTAIGGVAAIGTMASGAVTLSGSSATISTLSGGSVVNAGAALAVAGGTFAGTLSGSSGSLAKTGPATLVLAGSSGFSGATTVQAGTLRLANADALSASVVGVVAGGMLTLAPDLPQATLKGLNLSAGGTVDVGAGLVTVTAGLTPETLVAWITAGKGDGSWNGTSGITSSVAAAYAVAGERAVGWLDNGDGSLAFGYAAPGDCNLDGLIDALDSATLSSAARFNDTAWWSEGDFNYDGIYDDLDNALFVSTGLLDGGYYNTFPSAGGAIAVVPEPSGVGVATLGLAAFAALRLRGSIRRRRLG